MIRMVAAVLIHDARYLTEVDLVLKQVARDRRSVVPSRLVFKKLFKELLGSS